jgi:hypothetical protein
MWHRYSLMPLGTLVQRKSGFQKLGELLHGACPALMHRAVEGGKEVAMGLGAVEPRRSAPPSRPSERLARSGNE